MLAEETNPWTLTLVAAGLAVTFAFNGLVFSHYGGATTLVAPLLAASLACTGVAFYRVAQRVRRLELENEGLIEEISQEFDRVKDKIDIFGEALEEPRTLTPEQMAAERTETPMRRVSVK